MSHLFEMKKQRAEAFAACDRLLKAAEQDKRPMTVEESTQYDNAMSLVTTFNSEISRIESLNTLRGQIIPGAPATEDDAPEALSVVDRERKLVVNKQYRRDFRTFVASRGNNKLAGLSAGFDELGGYKMPNFSAAAYEGNASDGASIVPVEVVQQVIPLAPPPLAVESLAMVIPTTHDLKFPRKLALGTAAAKAEGTGSGSNLFTGTDPTMQQFTLSAYMVGHPEDVSWELLQDVAAFQAFVQDDILLSIAVLKEGNYISGSGTGVAQGILGNVTVPAACAAVSADSNGNPIPIPSLYDLEAALNPYYDAGAQWLMQKATLFSLRKAQTQANLFYPVIVDIGGEPYINGKKVNYSASMPATAAGASPILFGDFKRGYIIGVRGGFGVNIKILDQPKALEGLVTFLGYQRVDGRVRRSEAIMQLTQHT